MCVGHLLAQQLMQLVFLNCVVRFADNASFGQGIRVVDAAVGCNLVGKKRFSFGRMDLAVQPATYQGGSHGFRIGRTYRQVGLDLKCVPPLKFVDF